MLCYSKSAVLTFALYITIPVLGAGSHDKRPRVVRIKAVMFKFVPNKVNVKPGETVKLSIISVDVDHGFRIKSLGIDAPLQAGKTTEVVLKPTEVGTLKADCSKFCGPGHKQMELTINVRP